MLHLSILNSESLEGDIYLPVCFTCNKCWMSKTRPKKDPDQICTPCYHLPAGVFHKMYERALQRKEEIKYKKD